MKDFFPRPYAIIVLVMVLCLAIPAAGENCSIQTIAGTWAFRYSGTSFIAGPPSYATLHSVGGFMIATQIGTLNVLGDGTVLTTVWTRLGPMLMFTDTTAVPNTTITSIGTEKTADGQSLGCAATMQYPGIQPGDPPEVDKMLIFNGGNEARGMHVSDVSPFTSSLVVAKRISRAEDPAPRCGPQTLRGTYALQCYGPMYVPGATKSATSMMYLRVADENVTGTLYSRIGTDAEQYSVKGTFKTNPDCTGTGSLAIPGFLPVGQAADPDAKLNIVYVTYDQGKGAYVLPTDVELPNQTKITYSPISCSMERSEP